MTRLKVVEPGDLYRFARDTGLLANPGTAPPIYTPHAIPSVDVLNHEGQSVQLPPLELFTSTSFQLRVDNALVWPTNLGIVHDGHLLPGGFCHQSIWATDAGGGNNLAGWVQLPDWPEMSAPMEMAQLMGYSSHWGHFFTDTLDRMLATSDTGEWHIPLLTDAAGPCANAMQMLMQAGIINAPIEVWPLKARALYRFRRLQVHTLTSLKPAAPVGSLLRLREALATTLSSGRHTESRPLFVGRKQVKLRRLIGQEVLTDTLNRQGTARVIFPEEMTNQEAVTAFNQHQVILMPIGSAKFNLAFCRPGTLVIGIAPRGYAESNGGVSQMLRHMCAALKLDLAIYACRSIPAEGHRSHMQLHNDLVLDEWEVASMLAHFASR